MTSSTDDPLVTTDWLAARLDDPKVKIIDASYKMPGVLPLPSDDYLAAHIPGAVFFDVNTIADPNDPRPHMYPNAEQFARDVCGARHFLRRYRGRLRFRRLGRRTPGVVDVPVVRPSQREGAGWRLEEMAARGPPDAFRQGHAEARKIPGHARSQLCPQQAAIARQSGNPCRATGRCAPAPAFRRHRGRAVAGPPLRSHPRQPQRALCRIVRRQDRRDEAAGANCARRSRAPAST